MVKDDLLKLAPMTEYQAPELPTLKEVKSELLEKVPKRWKSKAVMATAVGLFGATTLTGCGNVNGSFTPIENTGQPILAPSINRSRTYCSDLHFGGSGGAPIYVAHLTETDALNLIGQQFAAAGINLETALPRPRINAEDIHYELGNFGEAWGYGTMFPHYVEMQLFNEASGTGVVLIKNWSWWLGSRCTNDVRASIERRFLSEHGITVEIIFETGGEFSWWNNDLDWDEIWERVDAGGDFLTDEISEQLMILAEQNLISQITDLMNN